MDEIGDGLRDFMWHKSTDQAEEIFLSNKSKICDVVCDIILGR